MKFNSNFKYDLQIGNIKEKELYDILTNKKIEVKFDLQAKDTGNIFVEYKLRGKDSGITKTESDYYCFAFGDNLHLIPTKNLKQICRKYYKTQRDVLGGDNNTSKGILLPIQDLL